MNTKTEQNSSGMEAVVATDHPDLVGGIVWSRIELEWINKRLSDAEAILAQKDAEILGQCRINGMGAEREATLLGKVERQSAALKLAKAAITEAKGRNWLDDDLPHVVQRQVDEALAAIDALGESNG